MKDAHAQQREPSGFSSCIKWLLLPLLALLLPLEMIHSFKVSARFFLEQCRTAWHERNNFHVLVMTVLTLWMTPVSLVGRPFFKLYILWRGFTQSYKQKPESLTCEERISHIAKLLREVNEEYKGVAKRFLIKP